MSLKSKFKTDINAANAGVWIDYPDAPNADGTIPGFKLARTSRHNKKYTKALRNVGKQYAGPDGRADFSKADEEAVERTLNEVFFNTVLLDWRNFQPQDDGKNAPFTPELARSVLGDEAWADLLADLQEKAADAARFREQQLEAEAKN